MGNHSCLDHLKYHQHNWTELHGEYCYQEWWECSACGSRFSEEELRLMEQEQSPQIDTYVYYEGARDAAGMLDYISTFFQHPERIEIESITVRQKEVAA